MIRTSGSRSGHGEQEDQESLVQCSVALKYYRNGDDPARRVFPQAYFSATLGSDFKNEMAHTFDEDDAQEGLDPEKETMSMFVNAGARLDLSLQRALTEEAIVTGVDESHEDAIARWVRVTGIPDALEHEMGSEHGFLKFVGYCPKATIHCDTLLIPSTDAEGSKTYTVKSRLRGLPEELEGQPVFSEDRLRMAEQDLDRHLLTKVHEQIKAAATDEQTPTLSDTEILEGLRSLGSDEFFRPLENFCLDCSLTSLKLGERPHDEAEGAKEETQ
jgi:hypothetical protein